MAVSSKSRLVASLLCIFLGYLGVDQFYRGKIFMGLLQILTTVLLGGMVWWFVRCITTLCGLSRDRRGNRVANWIK